MRANLPGRYLRFQRSVPESARFRTYLKGAIRNLVLEAVRDRWRRAPAAGDAIAELAPTLEESISATLDRRWLEHALNEAAWRLRQESLSARTRARARRFDLLYLWLVEQQTPQQLAARFQVHRTTVASLLTEARGRFVACLRRTSGVEDVAELKRLVTRMPQAVVDALRRARQANPDEMVDR